ncbi:hypothetical protein [Paraburkholderia megapolitana]|uniref:hypothetical protein n=1 Tax=Paraburkholderia megapolitana TaxID=420953 RepID=UPI00201386DB|nr:hypothetical protein [Paraburkholderia megapolitana]
MFDIEIDAHEIGRVVGLDEFLESGIRAAGKRPRRAPVERMYFFPAFTMFCTFALATIDGCSPPQFSLPHSPVAKAHVRVLRLPGNTFRIG